MKKKAKKGDRNLDKHLFEAAQQCHKRLWLDYHEPRDEAPSTSRQEMSRVGDELRELARTAFPKGVVVEEQDAAAAAARTQQLLADKTPVLFDAAFVADGVEARCDILVVHRDDHVDLFEIKSGTKVKHRYVNDLALQAVVLEKCGLKLKSAYLLHVNAKYAHKEGTDYPPMQLLRSADVTAKVEKQTENVARRLQQAQLVLDEASAPELPMGTFCRTPFPCPHFARCREEAPARPLFELPELSRQQETELHKEGIEELEAIPPDREGLTFQQRRTLASVLEDKRIVEPFVQEELRQCAWPLHFVAIAAITEPLPRFEQQRPWQLTPFGWAAQTLHEDGRVEWQSHVHADKGDPRPGFARTLARHLEVGGTIVCWGDEPIRELRNLLDGMPDEKPAVRSLLGHAHLDLLKLCEAGVFDPAIRSHRDLRDLTRVLLGDGDGDGADLDALDREHLRQLIDKARTPRVRAATREKVAEEIDAALRWQAGRIADVFTHLGEIEKPQREASPARAAASKPLPKLPE